MVKKIAGIKWSQTNRCWYLPLSRENYNKIHLSLQGAAQIANDELKHYLEKKKIYTSHGSFISKKAQY